MNNGYLDIFCPVTSEKWTQSSRSANQKFAIESSSIAFDTINESLLGLWIDQRSVAMQAKGLVYNLIIWLYVCRPIAHSDLVCTGVSEYDWECLQLRTTANASHKVDLSQAFPYPPLHYWIPYPRCTPKHLLLSRLLTSLLGCCCA